MDVQLSTDLVTRSINFHGQQLQKLWEGERGEQDLAKRNVRDLDFLVYGQRQKHLAFQDRGKRLRLHQFIVKKAETIFAQELCEENPTPDVPTADDVYAVMPPFEIYLNVDKQQRLRYFFQNVKKGDYILGTIVSKAPSGMMLKVLCSLGPTMRYVADLNVKAACPTANIIPAVDKKGTSRSYMMNDSVCCEVLEVVPDCDKMVCGMKGAAGPPPPGCPPPGLVAMDDFPLLYKKAVDTKGETYETVLEKSIGFNNPNNVYHLTGILGLGTQVRSNMIGLRCRFPQQEYASELRQVQASKWAFRSVADGIDHFKAGRHSEAFQCLNKALNIDPRNVEGLVARGALYANSGNFRKAIDDFEMALKLNPSHANARKYMGETLVALGRSYEEEEKFEDARKAYQNCLSIIPFHEEAQNSLEFLKNKGGAVQKNIVAPEELLLPALSSKQSIEVQDALEQLLKGGGSAVAAAAGEPDGDKKEKKKKHKSKGKKRRRRSVSSSSSSSSSASSHSSSSSSSSSSDSSTGSSESDSKSKRKKRRSRSHRHERQKSLSPLSKRMAMMDATHDTPSTYQFNKPAGGNTSFDFDFEQPAAAQKSASKDAEYEAKVRSFLEQNKEEDSDYENRVRKFLEETARWKKEKKLSDEKKKKKKKDKKAKKENKKKRKERKKAQKEDQFRDVLRKELGLGKEKRKSKRSEDDDYLLRKAGISKRLLDSLPELEELESKLSAYYALEKEKSRSNHSGSSSPVQRFDRSPSPTREQKARQAVAEAAANAPNVFGSKWKMHIGNSNTGGSRFKKKNEREEWDDAQEEAKFHREKESPKLGPSAEEKAISIRKAMAMKEPPPKKEPPPSNDIPKQRRSSPKPPPPKPPQVNTSGPVVLDKFGNFRIASPATAKKLQHDDDLPPLPPGAPPPTTFAKKSSRPPEPPGPPRLGSSSPGRKRRTPSRSRSRTSRSSSRSRSRSPRRGGYDRSRSHSYYSGSRSRSRSRSYYSRSRSRSRSRSGDRRRYRGGYRGRYNDRGTYYKPRLQYKNQRGGGNYRGRGGYRDYRDDRYGNGYRDYRGRGGRGYNNRGGRRPRGRFNRGGYRDYRDRRYRRSDSRSVSRDRSYSREPEDPMQKVNEEKEKINKYIDNSDPPPKHDGPLSEGEDRDDYNGDKYVDRQAYDGKWADKDADSRAENSESAGGGGGDGGIPSETNVEEMDKFLSKVKKEKKEEMMERNKDVLKSKQW